MKWPSFLSRFASRADWQWLPDRVRPTLALSHRLRPGWYLLSVRVHTEQRRLHGRLLRVQERSLIAGRLRRRVVRISRRQRPLELELLGLNASIRVSTLRITPLFAWRARRLVGRKLNRLHPAYAQPADAVPAFPQQWRDYNRLLSRHHYSLVGYDEWIEKVETKALLREADQARSPHPFGASSEGLVSMDATLLPAAPDSVSLAAAAASPRLAVWLWGDRGKDAAVERSLQSVQQQYPGDYQLLPGETSLAETDPQQWLLLLAVGDTLAPHALRRFCEALKAHPDAEVFYADEDMIDEQGHRYAPLFKPAWNLDFFLANPAYSHSWWLRSDRVLAACSALNAAAITITPLELLMEMALSCESKNIVHIPEVLYHFSAESEPLHANTATAQSLRSCLHRHGRPAEVELCDPPAHRLHWPLPEQAVKVSVIIPTRDHGALLEQCIDSLLAHPQPEAELEFLILDNGSSEPASLDYLQQLRQRPGFQVLSMPGPFNYARLNNQAVQVASGEVLILVNNDVQAISRHWLRPLLAQALRPDVGAVGARLLFDDDTVQHAGIILGIGGIAGHAHKYFPAAASGYQNRLQLSHQVSAVTAAVLAIRKAVFVAMDGFDADCFAVNYNDVDLCLRLQAAGYRNIYCSEAVFYHHESRSRGEPTEAEAFALWQRERQSMQARWGPLLAADPFYNPHLSLNEEDFSLWLQGGSSPPARRGL